MLGATGLVGSECLRLLLADDRFTRVVSLTRRPLPASVASPKLKAWVVDFDRLTSHADLFDVDQVLCALGTTVRQTPDKETYRTIDFLYPVTAAHLGLETGATHFLVVSAVGANSRSILFYNRLKGELEDALKAMPYRSLTIAQPSVLIGDRDEPRLSERIARALSFMTPRKYRPVYATNVAAALVEAARRDEPGVRLITNRDMGGRE